MSALTNKIERHLAARASLYLAVEDDGEAIVLSGMVSTDEARRAALDIATELTGKATVVDNIEVMNALPDAIERAARSERDADGLPLLQRATGGVVLEPGDFASQELLASAEEASGPEWSLAEDLVSEGDEVFVPAIDPVVSRDEVIGGSELSSMDSLDVDASSDGTYGDEAICDAIVRELREDAATTDLAVDVEVTEGAVRLTGRVETIDDAESAEEVAARVPGVVDVEEALTVAALER